MYIIHIIILDIYLCYIYANSVCFITKVLNIIYKQKSNLYQNEKKKSEFHVNMHYNLQLVHKHLTLCVQWNGNFVEQSVQDVLVLSFTESFFKKPSF